MKKYLVGGAVRNKLLKLPIQERDWVIVGSNPQTMINIGYQQVGKGFPVFLDPENHEEHALARTERKTGYGYTGFTCYTAPSVTIEEDLYRRDLTINAMACDINGNIIDPYHGQTDIKLRLLRHISHNFIEDPLRVLRVARFAAQLAHMNFTIAPETLILMKKMIYELPTLPAERIWTETKKALITNYPHIYFQILHHCGALKILFPELNILFDTPINPEKNLQKNTTNVGCYTMIVLSKIVHLTQDLSARFSILCHKIGLGTFLNNKQYNYTNYGKLGIPLIEQLCNRLKISSKIRNFAKKISEYHEILYNIENVPAETLMKLFKSFNCWRNTKKIDEIIVFIKINSLIYKNNKNYYSFQENFLKNSFCITKKIQIDNIIKDGFIGSEINKELYRRRLRALNKWKHINNNISIDKNKN